MATIIDIHNELGPAIRVFSSFWATYGVRASEPASIINLATGKTVLQVGNLQVDENAVFGGLGPQALQTLLLERFRPSEVFERLTLQRLPGLLQLDVGRMSAAADLAITPNDRARVGVAGANLAAVLDALAQRDVDNQLPKLDATLELYAGQSLLGAGAVPDGTHLVFQNHVTPLCRLNGEAGALREIRLDGEGSNDKGVILTGDRSRVEDCVISAVKVAAEVAGGRQQLLRTQMEASLRSLDVVASASDSIALGCSLTSAGQGARLEGDRTALVRCLVEFDTGAACGIEVLGSASRLVGNHVRMPPGMLTTPGVWLKNTSENCFLDKNLYTVTGPSGTPKTPDDGRALVQDDGKINHVRDILPFGFPQSRLSTRNLIQNGHFRWWKRNASAPKDWVRFPEESPRISRVEAPQGDAFLKSIEYSGPQEAKYGRLKPDELDDRLSDVLEGQFSVRISGGPGEAGIEQSFRTDGMFDVLTLSGWIKTSKSAAMADAGIELIVDGQPALRRTYSQVESSYDGEWRQLTVSAVVSAGSRHDVTARCFFANGQANESAVFDRLMVVASDSVPQFSDARDQRQPPPFEPEPNGPGWPAITRFDIGRLFIPIPNPTDPPPVFIKADLRLNGVSIQQIPGQLELTNVKAIDGYWRAQIDPAGLVVKSADTGPEDQISLVTKLDVELRLSTRRKRFY